ncbi:microtubule-associated protein [Theileria orientalis]|uniref:Microtubule-associated protein n=1 Tax=Theileria orientalis TaxID=68886 RepID=A0A976XJN5_THEOR|nr:microtubule-associated protein [Theileria orientalis]
MDSTEVYAQFINGADEKYDLEDSTYLISTNMDRESLSKMINELLNLEAPVSFDIIVDNQRLRETIAERMEILKIESESTIQLVYVLSVTEPSETRCDDLNDWISGLSYDSDLDLFAVCSYGGKVCLYGSKSMDKVYTFSNEKIKSSLHLCSNEHMGYVSELVCGHMNGLVEVYNINTNMDYSFKNLIATNEGFTDTVTSVVTDHSGKVIISGGYDNLITVYENVDLSSLKPTDSKSKKRSLSEVVLSQIASFDKHKKAITKLKFSSSKRFSLASSSMDGSLCSWDLNKKELVSSHEAGKALTCFDFSPNGSCVCTGSVDGSLTVWDLRSSQEGVNINGDSGSYLNLLKKASSRPFDRLVSDVSWNQSVNLVSAVGLDGNVMLVDVRSPKFPLQKTMCEYKGDPDRVTCTIWTSQNTVVYTTAAGLVNTLFYKEI